MVQTLWKYHHKAGTGWQAIGHRQRLCSAINPAHCTGNICCFPGFAGAVPRHRNSS
jgi:hypothetical protein